MAQIVDSKLQVKNDVDESGAKFYSVKEEPFKVYGLYNYREENEFKRLPDYLSKLSWGIENLYRNTAGGRVRFSTDSDFMIIRAKMSQVALMPHMPLVSSAGFDLYTDYESGAISRFTDIFRPEIDMKDGFEAKIALPGKGVRFYTLNFPSYSSVTTLEIGLKEGCYVGPGLEYANSAPIVFYGNSVTQGACSSRPGNAYENIVSRALNLDFINLGFSGWGRGEPELAEYMAGIKMSAFFSDYDHNAPDVEHLIKTHENLYKTIRAKNPDIPYVIMTRADFYQTGREENARRRDVIYRTYQKALDSGDKNVYFIDGSSYFLCQSDGICTVDGYHPNDYGFYRMAEAVEGVLRMILSEKSL